MATNRVFAQGNITLKQQATLPATVASGGPCVIGQLPGVALTASDTNGLATVQKDGVFSLSVKDTVGGGIAVGAIIYFDNTTTPKLNNTNTGVRFGYAMAAVGVGLTATIEVQVGY